MPRQRWEIEVEPAVFSEIDNLGAIFAEAFLFENPKLAEAMYAGLHTEPAVIDILNRILHSEYNKVMIAYDTTKGLVPDPGIVIDGEDMSWFDKPMAYGWVSWGIVSHGVTLKTYAACDLSVAASQELVATAIRDQGMDPRQLNARARLAHELACRTREGQNEYVVGSGSHLVVNTLVLWRDATTDSKDEMAFKLLAWAVEYAEGHKWPIWTQIPVGQGRYFRESGFTEVRTFTLNLNNYAPPGSIDWGTQEWVQMVYSPRSE